MKAVIVEIGSDYAVALNKNGEFMKVRKKSSFKVGYETEVSSVLSLNARSVARVASMAAVFLLALGVGVGAYCYNQPYSYINVDINPSVELTANMFNRIIGAEGINEDGKRLVLKARYKHETISKGVKDVLGTAVESGYLADEDTSAVMITLSGKSQTRLNKLEKEIEDTAVKDLEQKNVDADVLVEAVSLEKHDSARRNGISPGKQLLIDRLRQVNPGASVEDLEKAPVKQLIKQINGAKKVGTVNKNEAEDKVDNKGKDVTNKSGGTVKSSTTKKSNPGASKNKTQPKNGGSKKGQAKPKKESSTSNEGLNQNKDGNRDNRGNSGTAAGSGEKKGLDKNNSGGNSRDKGNIKGNSKEEDRDNTIGTDNEESVSDDNYSDGTVNDSGTVPGEPEGTAGKGNNGAKQDKDHGSEKGKGKEK